MAELEQISEDALGFVGAKIFNVWMHIWQKFSSYHCFLIFFRCDPLISILLLLQGLAVFVQLWPLIGVQGRAQSNLNTSGN